MLTANGIGTMGITTANLGSVTNLKLYLTDPTLNLNDPNNPNGGGGALVLETASNASSTWSRREPKRVESWPQ
jgi:hypothetical protein